MQIRDEGPEDRAAIRRLTDEAFADALHSSGTEGAIVDALRAARQLTLSLVAEEGAGLVGHVILGQQITGHVAFSPVSIGGHDLGWVGLGPVAVAAERRGRGTASALIRAGLERMRQAGRHGCVVLGEPAFYGRFGFAADPRLTFEGAPPEYFMALPFSGPMPEGEVIYHPAFYGAAAH